MKIHSYKLQNGDVRYKFHIYIGTDPMTGKEKTTTRSSFKTKKEAKDAYLLMQQEIQNGSYGKIAKDMNYGLRIMRTQLRIARF